MDTTDIEPEDMVSIKAAYAHGLASTVLYEVLEVKGNAALIRRDSDGTPFSHTHSYWIPLRQLEKYVDPGDQHKA